jgi:hypothetical protein
LKSLKKGAWIKQKVKTNKFILSILFGIFLLLIAYYFNRLDYRLFVNPNIGSLTSSEKSLLVQKRRIYQIIYTLSFFFGTVILIYSVMSKTLWRSGK